MDRRRRAFALVLLTAANLAVVGVAWLFHLSVAPGWKKGCRSSSQIKLRF